MSIKDYKYGTPYKVRWINSFLDDEFLANGYRKYRKVFDTSEITYLQWELRFYNKLFDEENWQAKTNIKIFRLKQNKRSEICDLYEEKDVLKTDNEVVINQGWGSKEVNNWEAGDYTVEAYINDVLVVSNEFFVNDIGMPSRESNPYFEVQHFKLFEGDHEAQPLDSVKYLRVFNKYSTRYVWCTLKIKNKLDCAWNLELNFNFYNDTGQLKTSLSRLGYIDADRKDDWFEYANGWGKNMGGVWLDDSYRVDAVFMDRVVASATFSMGEEAVAEDRADSDCLSNQQPWQTNNRVEEENLKEPLQTLNELIGLGAIKQQINEHIDYLKFLKLRKAKGFNDNENINLHSVFIGNPGTGKTTVVKLLGQIYQKMGLLYKGQVHEVDRADLIGRYIGQTAPKVREQIEKARGGILFIDEAYALARSKNDELDYGLEAIEILIKEMSDGKGDVAIMVAGYPDKMETFLEANPGLKSRFNYYFHFEDYTPDELMAIAEYAADKRAVHWKNSTKEKIYKLLLDAYRDRDVSFGNARYAYSLVDEAKHNMGLRLMNTPNVRELTNSELSLITCEDVHKISYADKDHALIDMPIDENLLKLTLDDLGQLVGMDTIVNEIRETVKLTRFYKETGKQTLHQMSRHMVFVGNPGTGKTTVARIISKIYKALGLLERGHLVEVSREDLVAGYSGQTAIKTKAKIEEAMGGVLFIDEAYALTLGEQDTYGNEAIEVILKTMEDKRSDFVLIVAGYPDNMDNFLSANPGLKSRFDKYLHFTDFDADSLYKIAKLMLGKQNMMLEAEAAIYLQTLIEKAYQNRDEQFGNARYVRQLVDSIIRQQHLRMANMEKADRTPEILSQIIIEDITSVKNIDKNINTNRRRIGF